MSTLIKNGTLVTAQESYTADIRLEGSVIAAIGHGLLPEDAEVVDAQGCYVFPGGVDPHTHLDMPFGDATTSDDFHSGSRGAVMGGVTTLVDFAIQKKGESLRQTVENWRRRAEGKSYADFGFHVAITDCTPAVIHEMDTLISALGVSTVKLFMAYKGLFQVDDGALLNVFKKAGECGILVQLHCENGDIINSLTQEALRAGHTEPIFHAQTRPDFAEGEAVHRAATLAKAAGSPMYVVHLSSKAGLEAAMAFRQRGQEIFLETCPQYLLLSEQAYLEPCFGGAKFVMSPPLRRQVDQQALWEALAKGWIDVVATDHCAFNMHGAKEAGRNDFTKIPNGAPGLETRFGLLYTYGVLEGRISLQQFVSLIATRPAQLMGLYPRKGALTVGSDGDLVVFDPHGEEIISASKLHGGVDYTPFEGFKRKGTVRHVFLRGHRVVKNGKLNAGAPQGLFLPRAQTGDRSAVTQELTAVLH